MPSSHLSVGFGGCKCNTVGWQVGTHVIGSGADVKISHSMKVYEASYSHYELHCAVSNWRGNTHAMFVIYWPLR